MTDTLTAPVLVKTPVRRCGICQGVLRKDNKDPICEWHTGAGIDRILRKQARVEKEVVLKALRTYFDIGDGVLFGKGKTQQELRVRKLASFMLVRDTLQTKTQIADALQKNWAGVDDDRAAVYQNIREYIADIIAIRALYK